MKVSMNIINPISFSSNNKAKNNSKKANIGGAFLAYATICAVFPFDYEKHLSKIDNNFYKLSLSGKAKNVAKVATPFVLYPLITLLGLKVVVDLLEKNKKNKNKVN